MILSLTHAADAWDVVRGTIAGLGGSSAGPVLIFCATPDPDALATARTLTSLLKADLVRYELHPVGGYFHLQKAFNTLVRGKSPVNPRAVLCVNCGAGVDLTTLLGLSLKLDGSDEDSPQDDVEASDLLRIFVLDSHRPYHLRNISSSRIFLFDDNPDEFDTSALPLDIGWEDEWGNVSDVESSSSSSSDEDERSIDSSESENEQTAGKSFSQDSDDDDGSYVRRRKRRNERLGSKESFSEDGLTTAQHFSTSPTSPVDEHSGREISQNATDGNFKAKLLGKRKRVYNRNPRGQSGKYSNGSNDPENAERRVLREYYAAVSSGMASACIAHNLAFSLRRANFDTLWAGIIGVTHQYLNTAIQASVYADAVHYCNSQIALLSPTEHTSEKERHEGDLPIPTAGYSQRTGDGILPRSICPSSEYKLDLVRHWNLHDSLLYSLYTTTRMAAWRQTGRRRLMELLATLGIPLKESRQRWCYMRAECKSALDERLVTAMRRFGLGKDIQYDSFVRILPGYRGRISAADVVYGLSALLELDGIDRDNGCLKSKNGPSVADMFASGLEQRFWSAYDAIDVQRMEVLGVGLELAIMSQKLVAEIGGEIVERRRFMPSGPFRYVFLRDVQSKELFAHPLLLKRLAIFLIEALIRQGGRNKPFVAIAPNPSRKVWLAVAAMSAGACNDFGHRFRMAAEKIGSSISFDGFDSAVCEIQDGQETEFIRYLHDCMI